MDLEAIQSMMHPACRHACAAAWAGGMVGVAGCSGATSTARAYDFDAGPESTADAHALNRDGAVGDTGTGKRPPPPPRSDADVDASDCPASAKLVYVTGEGAKLYSLYPPTLTFTLVGTLGCLSLPTHMTVDRQGVAWVVAGGKLYKASTASASCSPVSTWTASPTDFPDFALTFLGTASAPDDALYMLGSSGTLGSLDVTTGHVTVIGSPSVASRTGDMTTNGDGTLYFLAQAAAQTLNRLDPHNASVVTVYPTHEDGLMDQALAYYGGLFFDFLGQDIYTFDTATGKTTAVGKAPLSVTGAGQSTCVPAVAPPPP